MLIRRSLPDFPDLLKERAGSTLEESYQPVQG